MENKKPPSPLNLVKAKFTFEEKTTNVTIDICKNVAFPEKLYKYYSLSDYTLKGLKNSTIYFSHAHLLNDVMDGNFSLWNMENFIIHHQKITGEDRENTIESVKNLVKKLTNKVLECRGVLSLSDTYKNELLWIHYTNESGYCLEFETDNLKKSINQNREENDCLFFPISYDNLKQKDFYEYIGYEKKENKINFEAILAILYCFAQKDKFWGYENEWRFLLRDRKFNSISFPTEIINDDEKLIEDDRKSGGNIQINKDAISKVILAPLFFNNSRFNKLEIIDTNIYIYNFKDNNNGKSSKEFLEILKNSFNNKIYQVDKLVKNELIIRELIYKIEIIDIGNNYIKLIKTQILS
ncbi:hypothetical protein C3B47_07400 [Flavobacterium columnare]|uniref:DUF2971 domain-containing protein n=2 Tax=Flavobacterium columnare TaxID=996 RepID=UPI001896766F|nr:DUF2971 domain-containing protein [Flavobacterium columnare]MBF6652721.1 hypothetical protein [Flavobacterium columnare]